MKPYLYLGLVIAVLAIAGTAAYFFLNTHAQQPSGVQPSFPVSSTTAPVTTMTVGTQDGQGIVTKDFIHNGTTAEDAQNKGDYYLAGKLDYCNADGTCPSGAPSDEYHIVYFSQNKEFVISLIKEPLGKARTDAEQFLMNTLGLSQKAMCDLNYEVLTTSSVNPVYGGQELGFSFCPNAVKLP